MNPAFLRYVPFFVIREGLMPLCALPADPKLSCGLQACHLVLRIHARNHGPNAKTLATPINQRDRRFVLLPENSLT